MLVRTGIALAALNRTTALPSLDFSEKDSATFGEQLTLALSAEGPAAAYLRLAELPSVVWPCAQRVDSLLLAPSDPPKQVLKAPNVTGPFGVYTFAGQTEPISATQRAYAVGNPHVQNLASLRGLPQDLNWRQPWPSDDPALRAEITRVYELLAIVAHELLDAISRTPGLRESLSRHLSGAAERSQRAQRSDCRLEFKRYNRNAASDSALSMSSHRDLSALTFVLDNGVEGLELGAPSVVVAETAPDSVFHPVSVGPTRLLVHAGEMLERWTCGLLRAAPHRVRSPPAGQSHRLSVVFFATPRVEAPLIDEHVLRVLHDQGIAVPSADDADAAGSTARFGDLLPFEGLDDRPPLSDRDRSSSALLEISSNRRRRRR